MAVFKDRKLAAKLFSEFWHKLVNDFGLGEQLRQCEISVLFEIDDLDLVMFVDENGPLFGAAAASKKPAVIMIMTGDMAHKYWLDKVDVPVALATHKIKAKGSVNKVLQILPLFKSGQKLYPEYCEKYNLPLDV